MKQCAIFDLDGTLLDSVVDIAASCNKALEACGYPTHTLAEVKTYIGNGARPLIHRALPADISDEEEARVYRRFGEEGERSSEQGGTPFPGMVELLRRLREAGIRIAVNTNKPEKMTQNLVKSCFGGLVELTYGQQDDRPSKPDPAMVLHILEQFQLPKEGAVYIGDSPVDAATARNAGIDMLIVDWGYSTPQKLREAGVETLCHSAEELYDAIAR